MKKVIVYFGCYGWVNWDKCWVNCGVGSDWSDIEMSDWNYVGVANCISGHINTDDKTSVNGHTIVNQLLIYNPSLYSNYYNKHAYCGLYISNQYIFLCRPMFLLYWRTPCIFILFSEMLTDNIGFWLDWKQPATAALQQPWWLCLCLSFRHTS